MDGRDRDALSTSPHAREQACACPASAVRGTSRIGRLRLRVLGIDKGKTSFSARGFAGGTSTARAQLEHHAGAFVDGFNAALAVRRQGLAESLGSIALTDRGFAYEGAAMAFTLLDMLAPRPATSRLGALLSSHGRPHRYMCHVGAGWALAVLRRRPAAVLRSFDPFIRWLAIDGYGFHEGFFHTERSLSGKPPLRRPHGYEQRAFDQGLGRSLWFASVADVDVAAAAVDRLALGRRADLWSGLGLAAAYTTVATPGAIRQLSDAADPYAAHVVQGAAFAISARHEAGNVVDHTHLAAELLCNRSVDAVAAVVDDARRGLRPDGTGRAYERWRERIRERLAPVRSAVA